MLAFISVFGSVRSNRTHKNVEILKKFGFREPMFNSVRFDLVSEKSSRVSLLCFSRNAFFQIFMINFETIPYYMFFKAFFHGKSFILCMLISLSPKIQLDSRIRTKLCY